MTEIIASVHALQRAKERFGWDKETTLFISKHAFDKGTNLPRKRNSADVVKLFGSKGFVFRGNILITCYEVNKEKRRKK